MNLSAASSDRSGTIGEAASFRANQERPMQPVIDRIIAKFTLKQPMSETQSQAVRDDAARFAAELLENYRSQLVRRSFKPG